MKTILIWFAGFFEDHKGSASSKRATLYVCLFYLYLIVHGSLYEKPVDFNVLVVIAALIAFCVGAVTSEQFTGILNKAEKSETKVETTKTETKEETPG